MAFDLGMHTTLDDTNSKLDPEVLAIAARITPTMAGEFGGVWNLFQRRPQPFITDEFEILVRAYTNPQVTLEASTGGADWDLNSATTALPVAAGEIVKITIGDVLRLKTGEVVVVSDVDRNANTIAVYERGAGETTAAAQGTDPFTALIIGNAHREGRVDGEAMAEKTNKFVNYMQIVQENVDLSHADTEQARKTGRTPDTLKQEAMERVMRDLARAAIYNPSRENTADRPGMSRGLLQWLNLTGGLKTNVGGPFTEAALRDALNEIRLSGGMPTAIVMSVSNKIIFNGFTGADVVNQDVNERTAGRIVERYLADGLGAIPVVVDLDFPDDQIAIVDSRKMQKGWKLNDELRFTPHTDTHPRQNRELLHGKFGLAVENVGQSHHVLQNLG